MSIEEHEHKAHEYDQIIWDLIERAKTDYARENAEYYLESLTKPLEMFSSEAVRAAVQKLRDSKYDRP